VRAAQAAEILDVSTDDDFVDTDQLAAAQPDLEIRVALAVEERCVVPADDDLMDADELPGSGMILTAKRLFGPHRWSKYSILRQTTTLCTLSNLPSLSLILRSLNLSLLKSAVLSMAAMVGGRGWCVPFGVEERKRKGQKDRRYKAVWEKRFHGPRCVTRECKRRTHDC
jgi:hypothetical protein